MSFRTDLGKAIRNARLSADMTQTALAQKVMVSKSCICMYESGRRMPDIYMLSILSNVLDVPIESLVPSLPHYSHDESDGQTTIFDVIGEDDE